VLVPYVVTVCRANASYDIYSTPAQGARDFSWLAPVEDYTGQTWLCAQLLFWSRKNPDKESHLYINSPGVFGHGRYGDPMTTMHVSSSQRSTLCIGQACSMGSFLLAGVKPASVLRCRTARIRFTSPGVSRARRRNC